MVKKKLTPNLRKKTDRSLVLQQALLLHRSGKLVESLEIYENLLSTDPSNFDALQLSGVVYHQLGNNQKALLRFEKALSINPQSAIVLNNRGLALEALQKYPDALDSYNKALILNPNYAEAYNNKGNTLYLLGLFAESIASCTQAIKINTLYAEAYNNLGRAQKAAHLYEEAMKSYENSLSIFPHSAQVFYNRANLLKELDRYDEAINNYTKAIQLSPKYPDAYYNRGLLRLSLGQFKDGFRDYLFRWGATEFPSEALTFKLPRCTPRKFFGRLLLWSEQGLGDEIFYSNLLANAKLNYEKLTCIVDSRLTPILSRSFPGVVFVPKNEAPHLTIKNFDCEAPFGDLGYLLQIDRQPDFTQISTLSVNKEKYEQFQTLLATNRKNVVCGVSWKSANKKFGQAKSISLSKLSCLSQFSDVRFVNLQYGDVDREIEYSRNVNKLAIESISGLDNFSDIDGLLALIASCDVVITTSNVTAHLSGSISKPTAVLVPTGAAKIWYWNSNSDQSIWYPSLRLFHQDRSGSWDVAINALTQWFREFLQSRSSATYCLKKNLGPNRAQFST